MLCILLQRILQILMILNPAKVKTKTIRGIKIQIFEDYNKYDQHSVFSNTHKRVIVYHGLTYENMFSVFK